MSAAADSAVRGGNDSNLEQPNDAVPMKVMPPSLEIDDRPGDEAPEDVVSPASERSSPADPSVALVVSPISAHSGPADRDEPSAAASPKGKQKDEAPEPPSKEEALEKGASKEEKRRSIMAIGPAQDEIKLTVPDRTEAGSVCSITLLLTSGSRHPYKLDAKYLSRRNVAIPDRDEKGNPDPFSISIYTLKELILREWRSDWEVKPTSPSSIRLIYFGKLLDDKEPLKKYQFSTENPNVVHMSIRPQDLDEEEPKAGSKSLPAGARDGSASEGRCCVIL